MLMFKAGNDCWRGFRSRLPKSLEDSRCGSVRKEGFLRHAMLRPWESQATACGFGLAGVSNFIVILFIIKLSL